jgi:GNAT superfamily N-acetyltransferase
VRQASDVEASHRILAECGLDLEMRFGLSHWVPAYPLHLLHEQAAQGHVYEVTARDKGVIATFTLSREAPPYYGAIQWSPDGEPGVYVSRLAVMPAYQGLGVGRSCLQWIESDAAAGEARSVRLDAYTRHEELLRFYRNLSYTERGKYEWREHPLTCFEKVLDGVSPIVSSTSTAATAATRGSRAAGRRPAGRWTPRS